MEGKMKPDLFWSILLFDLRQKIDMGEMLKVLLTRIFLFIPHIHGSVQKSYRNSSLPKQLERVISEAPSNMDICCNWWHDFLMTFKRVTENNWPASKANFQFVCSK